MSYWQPRADAPICVCGGGKCQRKTDCRRFLERKVNEHATSYPVPPYREVPKTDETGRPLAEKQQVCEYFMPRESD